MANKTKLSPNLNKALHVFYTDTCQYCRKKCNGKGHVDHIVPIAKGGKDKLSNYILSCSDCNHQKKDKLLDKSEIRKHVLFAYKNMKLVELLYNSIKKGRGKKNQYSILNYKAKRARLNKSGFGNVTIKDVPQELWDRLKIQAKKEGRLFSAFVVELLTEAISERERRDKDEIRY